MIEKSTKTIKSTASAMVMGVQVHYNLLQHMA